LESKYFSNSELKSCFAIEILVILVAKALMLRDIGHIHFERV